MAAVSMDMDQLQDEAGATDQVAWLSLIEVRVLKSGAPDFATWAASLPRSATGMPVGSFWVDAVANRLVFVT